MELKLESDLSHQLKPVKAVAKVVEASMSMTTSRQTHQNPLLGPYLSKHAIRGVQGENHLLNTAGFPLKDLDPISMPAALKDLPPHLSMDVKMETGTGKTYVYTRTMFELHRRCGLNKFIIAVPTLPIKAGTASSAKFRRLRSVLIIDVTWSPSPCCDAILLACAVERRPCPGALPICSMRCL